ncbi:hypothetical protein FQA39_LY00971 [Lamprigera yunnana]|nr:hypothetical protein FQA39_LY00971 [Lamprigera yunnana]
MHRIILWSSIFNFVLYTNTLILEETSIDYKSCLLHLIQQFFKEDDTLCFVSSENHSMFPFGELTNPYIIVDSGKPVILKTQYTRNFVIFTKSDVSLDTQLNQLKGSSLWSASNSRRGKFLVIADTTRVFKIFNVFWKITITGVMVLVPSYDNKHLVYRSNPWSNGFRWNDPSTLIWQIQHCPENINELVKMPIRNYGGCYINFNINSITWKIEQKALHFLFNALHIYLNITITHKNHLYHLQVNFNDNYDYADNTKVVFQSDWMWITAAPVRVFRFETISSLFQGEVWMLTGLIFLITIIACLIVVFLFSNTSNKFFQFCHVFIEVTSLTIRAVVTVIPKTRYLSYIFLIYSFYALIIQTAFNTNLIRVLTVPHYSHAITSAKEIIESNMSVYVSDLMYDKVLRSTDSSAIGFSKLKNQLLITNNYSYSFDLIYNFQNAALLMPAVDFLEINGKKEFNTFTDNYIVDSINEIITILTESGIYKKHIEHNKLVPEKNVLAPFLPLNLQHLYFVFALFVGGLLLSVFVFMLEHLHYVYHKKKAREFLT